MHLFPLPDSWSPCLLCLSYTFCCSISLSSLIQQGKQAQFWVSWTDSSADTSLLWTTQRRSGSLILTVGRIHACSQTAASWTQCEPQHPLLIKPSERAPSEKSQSIPVTSAFQAGVLTHIQLWSGVYDVLNIGPLITAAHSYVRQYIWSIGLGLSQHSVPWREFCSFEYQGFKTSWCHVQSLKIGTESGWS